MRLLFGVSTRGRTIAEAMADAGIPLDSTAAAQLATALERAAEHHEQELRRCRRKAALIRQTIPRLLEDEAAQSA